MKAPVLALVLLLLAPAAFAAVPPDLAESSRDLQRFPSTRGQGSESERLKKFFDLYWFIRMREFPDLATYLGYPGLNDRWPDLSPETLSLIRRIDHEQLAALSSIDRSRLTPAEQVDYDLARRRIEMNIEGERFHDLDPFHNEYLLIDPMNGVDGTLAGVLGYMPARTVRDFEDMLARLRGFSTAVDQTIALLGKGLAAGITPPRVTLNDIPKRLLVEPADDPLKSPLLSPFQEMPEAIPATERERLRREAARVFKGQVAPAFRKLHDYLVKTYIPGARESIAMSDLPDGKAWYAYKLRNHTTTDLTPEQIHQLGLSEVKRIRQEMDELIATTGFKGSFEEFSSFLRTDPRFFYDKPEDLIAGYRDIAKRIDPELIKLFGRLPRLPYGVEAMESKTAPTAFYGNGSLAGGVPGSFLANTYDLKSRPKWEMEALTLHEAVPGHHLQYALAEETGDLPDWRKWDVYPAFSEGWGLYAESLGSELGLYKDPYSKFGQLTYEMWRAIRLVVDTGLHAFGWTRQQAIDYSMANSARPAHIIQAEVDRYITQPGSAPAYKLGELKIKELRAYAEKELGAGFDLRAFHDHILGHGQLPLDLLEKSVKAWVAETNPQQKEGTMSNSASPAGIDHLILGAADLDKAIQAFEERTGVRPVYGGKHPRGTHNALVSLGNNVYLEILALQPGVEPRAEDSDLAKLIEMTPVGWAVTAADPEAVRKALRSAGLDSTQPQPGSRVTSDGRTLRWQTFGLTTQLEEAPFFITWSTDTEHPSATSPPGCTFQQWRVIGPHNAELQRLRDALGLPIEIRAGEKPSFSLTLKCPKGTVVFGHE